MAINVLEMLRSVTAKKISGVEEIADRLFRGEKIPGEVIHATLQEAGRTPEDLQAMVDSRERIAGLVKVIKDSPAAVRRLNAIEKEITDQEVAFEAQRQRLRELTEKHEDERRTLKAIVSNADAARASLLTKDVLPAALWERLRAAEQACIDADEAYGAAYRQRPELTRAAAEMARYVQYLGEGKPVRHDGKDLDEDTARKLAKAAAEERDANATSIPALEAAWNRACEARDATRAAILKELGA